MIAGFGLILLIVIIFFIIAFFYAGMLLKLIRPSAIQIQLLGVHLLLFGVIVILAYDGSSGFGFVIGLIGLIVGIYGSFQDQNSAKERN